MHAGFPHTKDSNSVSSAFYKPWTSLTSYFLSLNPDVFSFSASANYVL